jgi:hypothetical protein
MANTIDFVKTYMTNKVGSNFEEQTNGSCLTMEYKINGRDVRFIVINMATDYANRGMVTSIIKEIKDETGAWNISGDVVTMTVKDNFYVDTATGITYSESEAYENVPDLDKPIPDTDPVEYETKEVLKKGYVNEVDFMVQANSQLFAILEEQGKKKVVSLYE